MKRRTVFGVMCLATAVWMGVCHVASARKPEPVALTPQGEKLLADGAKGGKYGAAMITYLQQRKIEL